VGGAGLGGIQDGAEMRKKWRRKMGDEGWGEDKMGPLEDTRRTIEAGDRSTVIPRRYRIIFLYTNHLETLKTSYCELTGNSIHANIQMGSYI
jgi:hypothetical protein